MEKHGQYTDSSGPLRPSVFLSGGPYGAVGVDMAFESMLSQIFGDDFIRSFKTKRPAAWVDLTIAFEARKRTAAPGGANALNISLPFSFIDYYKRHRGQSVEAALRRSKSVLLLGPASLPCPTIETSPARDLSWSFF